MLTRRGIYGDLLEEGNKAGGGKLGMLCNGNTQEGTEGQGLAMPFERVIRRLIVTGSPPTLEGKNGDVIISLFLGFLRKPRLTK